VQIYNFSLSKGNKERKNNDGVLSMNYLLTDMCIAMELGPMFSPTH